MIIRVGILLLSLKCPQICRIYFTFEMTMLLVNQFNFDQVESYAAFDLQLLKIVVNFIGLHYNFALDFTVALLTQILLACVHWLVSQNATHFYVLNLGQNLALLVLFLIVSHALITKAGNQFVKLEIKCKALEQLHDDIDEGVIIYN